MRSRIQWLGWAIFLGMSWTWCIGMFLPVLLLRDLGMAGFLVFAIPNVIGAAAMGWILRSAEQSREIVAKHSAACILFSVVTIVFHIYFAMWIIQPLAGHLTGPCIATAICAVSILAINGDSGQIFAAILTFGVSITAAILCLHQGAIPHVAAMRSALNRSDVLFLAPACVFGFFLCPYLDLTFHQARQAMDASQSRRTFAVGFGVFFALMLVFTMAYSGWFTGPIDRVVGLFLAAHFIAQSGFTMTIHAQSALSFQRSRTSVVLMLSTGVGISLALGFLDLDSSYHGLRIGDVIYRCFMGFYGIVFPAYAWICVIRPQRTIGVAAIAIVIAMPMFWMAFVEQKMIWLVPDVALAILVRLIPSPRYATAV